MCSARSRTSWELEHINLNTYYTRPMADVFDITSSGAWTFTAVASTLLKQTTLALSQQDNKVQFAQGPDLKPTHNAKYWAAKTRGFDFSSEDRVPADLYNKILWEGLKRNTGARSAQPVPDDRRRQQGRQGRRQRRRQVSQMYTIPAWTMGFTPVLPVITLGIYRLLACAARKIDYVKG